MLNKILTFLLAISIILLVASSPQSQQMYNVIAGLDSSNVPKYLKVDANQSLNVAPGSGTVFTVTPNSGTTYPMPSVTAVTTLSSANATVTLTLPAAGSGLFHYIVSINAARTCTTAIAGTALLGYTSTNLPGSLAWTAGNACAVGSTNQDIWNDFTNPLKSSVANTDTTIVAPAAGATGQIRVTAYYYTGT